MPAEHVDADDLAQQARSDVIGRTSDKTARLLGPQYERAAARDELLQAARFLPAAVDPPAPPSETKVIASRFSGRAWKS
jgi:hypothetical protein